MLLITTLLTLTCVAGAAQLHPGMASDAGAAAVSAAPGLSVNQGGCKTLSQAVEQVRRQYNGRIVSAETELSGNQEMHVIKVLTADGKVKTVRIPGCRRN
jgi:hypothetical protein